jgi:hypothetical protein
MKLRIYDPVLLAIDLRHRRFGYAAFQGHRTLLEWGQRYYPAIGDAERAIAQTRLSKLMDVVAPDLILIKQERWDRAYHDRHLANPLKALRSEATRRTVPIRLIREETVRTTFGKFGCHTKPEIAATLASFFPELLSSIPPPRKAWQTEHSRMSVFDAVALGVAYWHSERDQIVVDRRR